jgi:hypothetical protein
LPGHDVHSIEPDDDEKVLAAQLVHRPPTHSLPAGHALHGLQAGLPAESEKVPTVHAVQSPAEHDEPAAHEVQSVHAAVVAKPSAE